MRIKGLPGTFRKKARTNFVRVSGMCLEGAQ
jgi:hypothetical protein